MILQVLGSLKYREVEYLIEGKQYRRLLSSFALKDYVEECGGRAEIHLLAPESLVEVAGDPLELLNNQEEFRRTISDRIGEKAEVHFIPSVGEYSGMIFCGSAENVIVAIFKELVKGGFDIVFGDVSTGQNIYTISMVEALRRYIVYRKLERIIKKDEGLKFKLVFIPPVTMDTERVALEFYELDAKAFFSLPKAEAYRICRSDVKEFNEKYRELLRRLNMCLSVLRAAFNAISMNTPLAFYHPEVLDFNLDVENIEADLLKLLDDVLKPEIIQSGKTIIRRRILDSSNVANIFYSLGLLKSIKEFASTLSEPELDAILKSFSDVYSKLGLESNIQFLRKDVSDIKNSVPDGFSGLYIECLGAGGHGSENVKRNFFAHSGFLREATIVERCGNRITARWERRYLNEIKKWIENPK